MPELLRPFWASTDGSVKFYQGHVIDVLRRMRAGSVHAVITSPPYWGLRSYLKDDHEHKTYELGGEPSPDCLAWAQGLPPCGACFVCNLVAVYREVRRVLHDSGTCWLNLGDSYSGGGRGTYDADSINKGNGKPPLDRVDPSIPGGNLLGVPWRVALALQADGWILRSDVPWVKRSPMPESVKNRPAKALEYVFLLAKRPGYYFDMEAVKPRSTEGPMTRARGFVDGTGQSSKGLRLEDGGPTMSSGTHRNFRQADLWFASVDGGLWAERPGKPHGLTGVGDELVGLDVTTAGYPGAHFATYPPKLIEPLVKASTSEHGCCVRCGAPWRRVVQERKLVRGRPNDFVKRTGEEGTGNSCANSVAGVEAKTLGWWPTCRCDGLGDLPDAPPTGRGYENPEADGSGDHFRDMVHDSGRRAGVTDDPRYAEWLDAAKGRLPAAEGIAVRPCVILDPFCGSGTTSQVAFQLGRHSVGIDLSAEYLGKNAMPRLEGVLLGSPATAHLAGRKAAAVSVTGRPARRGGLG